MKALIYSPYFETIGGGERYMLTAAECLLNQNWAVDIFWDKEKEIAELSQKFDLVLDKAEVLGRRPGDLSFWQKLGLTRNYDLIFWLSNGSLPVLFGRKNYLHFQRPFQNVGGKKIGNQIKLGFIEEIICNSKFTKKYIDQEFGVNSKVLYPPVDVDQFQSGKKQKMILSVGRFEQSHCAKKQGVMVKVFKRLVDGGLKDWRFVLIGGSLSKPEKNKFLIGLKKEARDYPIEFRVNTEFDELKQFYSKAKIFWHAAGYRVPEDKPELAEHFGIAPVEAMAAGCVPLVVDRGGLKEIVRRGVGERWKTLDELEIKSLELIKNEEKYKKYQQNAIKRAEKFSKQKFCQRLRSLINKT